MGRIISRKYEELELLGQGGQAAVYKVRHVDLKTILALKILPSYLLENEEMVARFNREALLMARLHHRNIVRVLGNGHDEELNCHYIVMENIQGRTLKQYLREKGPLPLAEVLELVRQVAAALDYAHNQTPAVIHRDIKPSNIMIEDLTGRAVVLDFGIAKELDGSEGTRTRTGMMIGTWKYSSPEQLRHEPLTGSADIYSLGLVMYEMYAGAQFFVGLDERAVIGRLLYNPQELTPSFSRPTPQAFISFVTNAIAKDRNKRYSRMADFLNALESCWSVLDETKTQVLTAPEVFSVQPELGRDRIEEVGEQIHKLEQERQVYLITLMQRQVREARAQAEKAGAPQWASSLFTEAGALEEKGEASLRETHYAAAQEAYAAALNAFIQASKEAAALALQRQVKQLQQAVEAAKLDAERYGAGKQTQAFYKRAVALQEQADVCQKQGHYDQARQIYSEAKSLFEDARDLAYHDALKREAETEREQANAKKESAIADSAQDLTPSLTQEAATTMQQAEAALDHDEFTQARALYQRAGLQYEQAQRQARSVRRQQEIAAIAEHVQRWQQRTTELGIESTDLHYQQAWAAQQQATTYFTAGEYTQAEGAFKLAQQLFEDIVRAIEREQQQQALHAQTDAQRARDEAEQAVAQQWAAEIYREASDIYRHAELSFAQGVYAQAMQEFVNAQRAFVTSRDLATQNALKQAARTAQTQMLTMRQAAEQAGAQAWASAAWRHAVVTEQEATSTFQHGDFVRARTLFLLGQEQYFHAMQQAEAERVQQQQAAIAAAEEVRSASERAVAAEVQETSALYQQAMVAQQQAEKHVAAQEYESAVQVYGHALALYAEAIAAVEHERQLQAVSSACQQMTDGRESARAVNAKHYVETSWNEVEQIVTKAQQCEAQGQFTAAIAQYQQAAQRFITLRDEAVTQALYQKATVAQQQMQAVKAQGAVLQEWAPALRKEAEVLEIQAEHALQDRRYEQAVQAYLLAKQAYQRAEAHAEAERRRQEEQQRAAALYRRTESARQAADNARRQAEEAKAETYAHSLYRRAIALYNNAEDCWQQQSYEQAVETYPQAQQIFTQARDVALDEALRGEAEIFQRQLQMARETAVAAEAVTVAASEFNKAKEIEAEAEAAFAHRDWTHAGKLFVAARQLYSESEAAAQAAKQEQRQTALRAAAKVRSAHAQASAAGVDLDTHPLCIQAREFIQYADALFATHDYIQSGQQYEQACQCYEESVRAVEQDRERAATEHAREQMETGRAAAQQLGAKDRFISTWRKLEQDIANAQRAEIQASFREATRLYVHVTERFMLLQHAAQEELAREKAEAVRGQLQAKQIAPGELWQWASEAWSKAQKREGEAEQAYQDRHYDQAATLYQEATQLFVHAQQHAEQEQQAATRALQQRAEEARQECTTAQEAAIQVDASHYASLLYNQARSCEEQGEQFWRQENYAEAAQAYEEAQRGFAAARELAKRERSKDAAEKSRAGMHQAQEIAVRQQAEIFAAATHHEATVTARQADLAFVQENFTLAQQLYQRTQQLYEQAQREANVERQRRQAQAAAEQMHAAQQQATTAEAGTKTHPLFKQAQDLQQRAAAHFAAQEYEQAAHTYAQAQLFYEDTVRAVQMERQQAEARNARQHLSTVRAAAEQVGAGDRFSSEWSEAQLTIQEAQQQEEKQEFRHATALYLQAAERFSHLQKYAEQQVAQEAEQHQQRIRIIYQQTEQSQQKAEQAEAPQYAADIYAAGLHRVQEGQRQRTSKIWELAESHFVEAQKLFVQSAKLARRQKARQTAEAARTKTRTLYAEVQQSRGEVVFPERFAEATDALTLAERAWAREEFAVAQKNFDQTFRLFRQLTQDIQRDRAEQAKMRAQLWQQKVEPATGEQQRGAINAFAEGERYFQQEKYQEAQGQYEQAASLWAILLQQTTPPEGIALSVSADTTDAPAVILPPAQKQFSISRINTRYVFLGATVLVLVVAMYQVNWFRSSVDITEPKSSEKRQEAKEQQFSPKDSRDQVPQLPSSLEIAKPALPFPTIVGATPNPGNEFVLKEGDQQKFAVQITNTAKGTLRYVWRLNGKEQVSTTNEWIYKPNFEEGNATIKVVEVTITDSDNQKVNQQWHGRVQNVNRAPQIQMASPPPGQVKVDAEGAQRFVIEASDLDRDDRLAIAWFLDGQKVAEAKQWDFHASASEETHQVTVEVADAEGLKAQLAWNIAVQAQAPLTLTRALPDPAHRLTVDEGKSLAFAVVVQGGIKGPLRYLWQLDGKPQRGDGGQWTYQPTYEDGGGTPKTVGVIVTDSANHRVQQQWQIDVHDVNRPPQIQSATPRPRSLEIPTNATQDFAVEAIDLDRDDHLTYAWLVNGQEVTHEKRWQFRAPSTPGTYTIVAEVSDVAGVKRQQVWEVLVKAVLPPVQPPLWKLSEPQEGRLKVQTGQGQDFLVVAEMAEGGQGNRTELRYVWTVNGETRPVREGRFRLLETSRPGMYEVVAVAIGPQGLKSIPKRWTVEVQPLPQPSGLLSEAEVRTWLETYRRAFEEKNTAQLVQLGTHSQTQADALAKTLLNYRLYRVAVIDVSIRCEGSQADLTFKRRDTMEDYTKDTDLITFGLEKGTDGRISVVRR